MISTEVEPPESLKTYDIFTEIRKPTLCKIEIQNNNKKEVLYKVIINGSNLSGESDFYLEPMTTKEYQLVYYPFQNEKKKCKIGFLNDEEGEMWFDLNV